MQNMFLYNKRLGISIPVLANSWNEYTPALQEEILIQWEEIRGLIPDRIAEIERKINNKQAALEEEDNFQKSCQLNEEIAELASIINDLWIWYRTDQDISAKTHL
ncbi:hypothetical protein [Priestia flexa]|uniref:hypothetical protein n=1 Tax=Priestia flexa TaxID=86664 RepID=UPI00095676DE|nr:hypothetical protein [Priestia flexa]MBY6085411.1 hypothetical protein [Priestia flexa]SIR52065.1 hypothetical protein SAMN05880580_12920 [Priestia flexa]